jgi:hypothetical protein
MDTGRVRGASQFDELNRSDDSEGEDLGGAVNF